MSIGLAVLPGTRRSCKHHWPVLSAPRRIQLGTGEGGLIERRHGILACATFVTVWARPLRGTEIRQAQHRAPHATETQERTAAPQRQQNYLHE